MSAEVKFDGKAFEKALGDFPKQMRFAAMNALNEVAKAGQAKVRQNMAGMFTYRGANRRTFLERQVKVDFWKRSSPTDTVRISTQGPAGSDSHIAKFEDQGQRTPTGGRKALAVPVRARPSKTSIVPKSLRIPQLGLTKHGGRTIGLRGVFVANDKILQRKGRGWHQARSALRVSAGHSPPPWAALPRIGARGRRARVATDRGSIHREGVGWHGGTREGVGKRAPMTDVQAQSFQRVTRVPGMNPRQGRGERRNCVPSDLQKVTSVSGGARG